MKRKFATPKRNLARRVTAIVLAASMVVGNVSGVYASDYTETEAAAEVIVETEVTEAQESEEMTSESTETTESTAEEYVPYILMLPTDGFSYVYDEAHLDEDISGDGYEILLYEEGDTVEFSVETDKEFSLMEADGTTSFMDGAKEYSFTMPAKDLVIVETVKETETQGSDEAEPAAETQPETENAAAEADTEPQTEAVTEAMTEAITEPTTEKLTEAAEETGTETEGATEATTDSLQEADTETADTEASVLLEETEAQEIDLTIGTLFLTVGDDSFDAATNYVGFEEYAEGADSVELLQNTGDINTVGSYVTEYLITVNRGGEAYTTDIIRPVDVSVDGEAEGWHEVVLAGDDLASLSFTEDRATYQVGENVCFTITAADGVIFEDVMVALNGDLTNAVSLFADNPLVEVLSIDEVDALDSADTNEEAYEFAENSEELYGEETTGSTVVTCTFVMPDDEVTIWPLTATQVSLMSEEDGLDDDSEYEPGKFKMSGASSLAAMPSSLVASGGNATTGIRKVTYTDANGKTRTSYAWEKLRLSATTSTTIIPGSFWNFRKRQRILPRSFRTSPRMSSLDYMLNVDVALKDIEWPGVGVYIYNVAETAGTTAGVTYSDKTAKLKVTVAYDEGTDTYYTAFVTMALEDSDNNGIDDTKDDGNFTNTYSAGNLQISKTVTGNMGSQEQYFAVNVKLTGVNGKTYGDSYAVTGGSKIEDGTATCTTSTIKIGEEKTFYLKHNETITIANLPYDVTYTVEEQDYTDNEKGGYDEAAYTFSDESKKIDSATDTVGITNNKGITVDTGIYTEKLPYILLGVIAAAGIVVMFAKRRPSKED